MCAAWIIIYKRRKDESDFYFLRAYLLSYKSQGFKAGVSVDLSLIGEWGGVRHLCLI